MFFFRLHDPDQYFPELRAKNNRDLDPDPVTEGNIKYRFKGYQGRDRLVFMYDSEEIC